MPFLDRPSYDDVTPFEGGRPCLKLTKDLIYERRTDGGYIRVSVPRGFVTDLATTPRILWSIFPPWGNWNSAAILHDYLSVHQVCSRFLCDALFREAMRDLGVPLWRRVVMYYAVRLYAIATGKR